jgi:hypothetical protein
MARGNAFLCIPKSAFKDPIPNRVKKSYGWKESQFDEKGQPVLDAKGEPVQVEVHPTWEQVAAKFKANFGEAREVKFGANDFVLIELELSFLSGEIEDLVQLKKSKVFPRYRIFTNKEAKAFLRGDLGADAETF